MVKNAKIPHATASLPACGPRSGNQLLRVSQINSISTFAIMEFVVMAYALKLQNSVLMHKAQQREYGPPVGRRHIGGPPR
ncbi:hypothetical protein MgSA37_03885 [Mucilaginibacter gotjawali]|uniref:Uncharacterized protein n=2 Tax=Mucilaginibacter gotjawali TaxID=1550579 RepID=A0A839SMW4_9SPHI|nr:hypothetical protein [Mucilaginibacter gotjawali]BAU55693.1 hypothetical protein MgSA37_03885 [Mucilaginibacter gotjawali]